MARTAWRVLQQRGQNEKMAERAPRDASTHVQVLRRSRSVSRPYMIPSTRHKGELVSLRRFYASVHDHNFPSLAASFFSWRSVAASTSSFLHVAINLRPPFVAVLTHISASNAVAFQSPAMPNAWMSRCAQSAHSFFFHPSSPHCTLKVSQHDSLWQPLTDHSNKRPRLQRSSRAQRRLNALTPGYLKGMVIRDHPMVWSLALSPDDSKQDPMAYSTKFRVGFLAKGLGTVSIQ